ncbi:type II toxin-antitoxin system HicA family toxin [Streptomyces yerevanensis]|uniref:type II toxin-antitoxin system HicA family toxin n=1 Tax=Streptomyces yerevanensis TaxID=66378 RepID=UPI001B8072C3|nr:type II toxin-antitoxin system HicA family toxin [Streptomyces yerevanensis]
MTASMKRRDLERKLRAAGCVKKTPDKGPHSKWTCPCGKHIVPIPRHRDISPGVIDDAKAKLECLPEGWMK